MGMRTGGSKRGSVLWGIVPRGVRWIELLVLVLAAAPVIGAPAQTDRTVLDNSVVALSPAVEATARPLQLQQLSDTMEIEVALRMRNRPKLMEKIGRGETVSRAELDRDYLPLASDYESVRKWVAAQGLRITGTSANRMSIFARGTILQLKQCFQTDIVEVDVEGAAFRAARTSPSVPAAIAAPVLGINGLQPYIKPKRLNLKPAIANQPPYLVNELRKAYAANGVATTGSGQTIAILIDMIPRDSDLTAFWSANSIPQSLNRIQKVLVTGTAVIDTEIEATLDVEWSSGMAPNSTVRIYSFQLLDWIHVSQGLDYLIGDLPTHPAIRQLSLSFGEGETDLGASFLDSISQKFLAIASAGVSIFVSSGDSGSNEGGILQVSYPASDPNVSGVGGTSIILNTSTGLVTSETAWAGSGGGISAHFARPSWQTGAGVAVNSNRQVPDLSLAADPNTGGYLVFSGAIYTVGGTSWGAPTWAAFCALINEARARMSLGPLGNLGPKVYPLLKTFSFSDITSGANGAYRAAAGYDLITGLGVPRVATLLQVLTGSGSSAVSISAFTPTAGAVGTAVTITGLNLSGATAVSFNNMGSSFTVDSFSQITATVPVGATSGPIAVTTPNGSGTSASSFTLLPPLTNDNFADALVLTGSSGTLVGTNVSATKEPGEPDHAGNPGGHSVWYRWTALTDGTCVFDTRGSSFDTLLAVYTGTDVAALTLVAANDDARSSTTTSSAAFIATAGTVYSIAVDGHSGSFGTIYLNWAYGVPALPDLAPCRFSGWSAPVVVTSHFGTTLDSPGITRWDPLYVDFGIGNIGDAATAAPFDITLSLDGTSIGTWTCTNWLDPGYGVGVTDHTLGILATGTHTLLMVIDPNNAIVESDKTNNTYTKSIRVLANRLRHDFNGDGIDDLLFQNTVTTGLGSWTMDGSGHVKSTLGISGAIGAWKAVACADINGDGTADIILQNASTTAVAAWLMNGSGRLQSTVMLCGATGTWKVVGAADLNSDGIDDIILQNTATTGVSAWIMDGQGHIQSVATLSVGGNGAWKVAGTADIDGDGIEDILLQNTATTAVNAWIMDGHGHVRTVIALSAGGNAGWSVVGAADIDGDGIDDLVLQNAATTGVTAWIMDGHGHVKSPLVISAGGIGAWRVIEK